MHEMRHQTSHIVKNICNYICNYIDHFFDRGGPMKIHHHAATAVQGAANTHRAGGYIPFGGGTVRTNQHNARFPSPIS